MTSSFLIRNILNKNKSIFTASIAFISSNKSFNDLKIHSEDAQLVSVANLIKFLKINYDYNRMFKL